MAYLILSKNKPDSIIRLKYNDVISSPGLFPKKYYSELLSLPEDKGGNIVARKYPNLYIETDNELEIMDVDTKDDLDKLVRISN